MRLRAVVGPLSRALAPPVARSLVPDVRAAVGVARGRSFVRTASSASHASSSGAEAPGASARKATPAHHGEDGVFVNPWPSYSDHGPGDVWKMLQGWDKERSRPVPQPVAPVDHALLAAPTAALQATWLGHAAFLVQQEGYNLLTDPAFSDRCFPVQWAGPQRFTPVPAEVESLPPIDAVLLSHTHYDHLDWLSVKRILAKSHHDIGSRVVGARETRAADGSSAIVPTERVHTGTHWFAPLRVGSILVESFGVPAHLVHELDWWEEASLGPAKTTKTWSLARRPIAREESTSPAVPPLRVLCTPAQHHTARGMFDRNRALWCGWAVLGERRRYFFSGDTGYRHVPPNCEDTPEGRQHLPVCPAFRELGERCVLRESFGGRKREEIGEERVKKGCGSVMVTQARTLRPRLAPDRSLLAALVHVERPRVARRLGASGEMRGGEEGR